MSGKGKSTFLIAQSPLPMSAPVRAPPAGAALSITDQAKSPKTASGWLNALTVTAQNPPRRHRSRTCGIETLFEQREFLYSERYPGSPAIRDILNR